MALASTMDVDASPLCAPGVSSIALPNLVSPDTHLVKRKTPTPMRVPGSAPGSTRSGLRRRDSGGTLPLSPAPRERVVSVCGSGSAGSARGAAKRSLAELASAAARSYPPAPPAPPARAPSRGVEAFDSDEDDAAPTMEARDRRSERASAFENKSLFSAAGPPCAQPVARAGAPLPGSVTSGPATSSAAGAAAVEASFRARLASSAASAGGCWGSPGGRATAAEAKALRSFARKAERIRAGGGMPDRKKPRGVHSKSPSCLSDVSSLCRSDVSTTDDDNDPHASLISLLWGGGAPRASPSTPA